MELDHRKIFNFFALLPIGIIGSSLRDIKQARDYDVLVHATVDFPALVKRLGLKYNGWDTPRGHIRRANLRIPGVSKPVQLISHDRTKALIHHPHVVLLRDGTVLHPDKHFIKTGR